MRSLSILPALVWCAWLAFAQPAARRGEKPDLHGGGAKPSLIPNHAVTTVTLPGFHFTGAAVTVRGDCRLAGYKVVSDSEIQMDLEGARAIDDKEDACFFTVATAAGSSTSWIIVDLTPDEQKEKDRRQEAKDRAKAEAIIRAAGHKWTLRFADGTTEVFTAQGFDSTGMPQFASASGETALFVVPPDGRVLMIEGKCVRGGRLVGNRVEKGESQAGCAHPGEWSGTREP